MLSTTASDSNVDLPLCTTSQVSTITGILITKSIYVKKCHLNCVLVPDQEAPFIAQIHFPVEEELEKMRSYCDKSFRVGDKIKFSKGVWGSDPQNQGAKEVLCMLRIPNVTLHTIAGHAEVIQEALWSVEKCRPWKIRYFAPSDQSLSSSIPLNLNKPLTKKTHQRSRFLKRQEGEIVTNFIVHMFARKLNESDVSDDPKDWGAKMRQPSAAVLRALENGVWDVAGGVGLASMSLSLRGIRSTVVDPRSSAGCLAKRDRRAYKNALLESPFLPPFETKRAWVGKPPNDTKQPVGFADLPVVDDCCEASCIVALHPDEATEPAVDLAIRHEVPFCVIPCCVFAKLFPNRRLPDGGPVSSYENLLDYLQAKHKSIQRIALPFEGANIALWSIF